MAAKSCGVCPVDASHGTMELAGYGGSFCRCTEPGCSGRGAPKKASATPDASKTGIASLKKHMKENPTT